MFRVTLFIRFSFLWAKFCQNSKCFRNSIFPEKVLQLSLDGGYRRSDLLSVLFMPGIAQFSYVADLTITLIL